MKTFKPEELATNGLLKALDANPRNLWPDVILRALTAVRTVAMMDAQDQALTKPQVFKTVQGPSAAAGSAIGPSTIAAMTAFHEEDRTLSKDKTVSQDEADEELGHAFMREFAGRIGCFAREHGITPNRAAIDFETVICAEKTGDETRLVFVIEGLTVKGKS